DYRGFPAISFQCHPEFEPDYAAALYRARRGKSLPEAEADAAIASLTGDCDRRLLAGWIVAFLRRHAA
ncbi:MAG: type 1 glutamine amidotransferase, partial [Hyphomonas sp.]